jgi:hypothetical protein
MRPLYPKLLCCFIGSVVAVVSTMALCGIVVCIARPQWPIAALLMLNRTVGWLGFLAFFIGVPPFLLLKKSQDRPIGSLRPKSVPRHLKLVGLVFVVLEFLIALAWEDGFSRGRALVVVGGVWMERTPKGVIPLAAKDLASALWGDVQCGCTLLFQISLLSTGAWFALCINWVASERSTVRLIDAPDDASCAENVDQAET